MLEKYPDYKVFVTGHSLGGALALLLALIASTDDRIPKPITCVSLGSLLVGDRAFQRAFQRAFEELETLGWIRHLRVTSQYDHVPCLPPFTCYKPVGMNLQLSLTSGRRMYHVNDKNPQRFDDIHNTYSNLWRSYRASGSVERFFEPRLIPEYLRRLEREKDAL